MCPKDILKNIFRAQETQNSKRTKMNAQRDAARFNITHTFPLLLT